MQRIKPAHVRKDKTCLNCGATVHGRYCSGCGQENTDPKESLRHLIGHFIADFTHYDSKFFKTIRDLIFKPGFLTVEYNSGKRAAYLNPIRMYIFISAFFFLVLFSGKRNEETNQISVADSSQVNTFSQHLADSLRKITNTTDTLTTRGKVESGIYRSLATRLDTAVRLQDSIESVNFTFNSQGEIVFNLKDDKYATVREYMAEQDSMPASKRDNFASRYVVKKLIFLTHEKYQKPELVLTRNIEHDIPKIMFVLLPLFALITGFFFSRKKYWYTQHVIFSLHAHSFIFLFQMFMGLVDLLLPMNKLWLIMASIDLGGIFIYLWLALRRAYSQSLLLSFIKALGIFILYSIAILVSNVALIIVSFILLK